MHTCTLLCLSEQKKCTVGDGGPTFSCDSLDSSYICLQCGCVQNKKEKECFFSSVSLSLAFLDFYCFPLCEMGSSRHSKVDLNVRRFHRRRSRTILQPHPKGLSLLKIFLCLNWHTYPSFLPILVVTILTICSFVSYFGLKVLTCS
jgi:hypothetical protein